jgi:FkbM family methyltransferase
VPHSHVNTTLQNAVHRAAHLGDRGRRAIAARGRAARFRRRVPTPRRADVLTIGDLGYGGYQVPADALGPESVVLSAGAGTDTSFEALLVDRFGCRVHVLDPVPTAAAHVADAHAHEPRITFEHAALWTEDTDLTFHEPEIPGHVSHSATDLHRTPVAFLSAARSVGSLRAEHGWDRVDLLKISAEGAEFAIIDSVLAAAEPVRTICVEFAQPAPVHRVEDAIAALGAHGYATVAASVRPFNWKMTFRRQD